MAVYPTDKGSPGTWGAECSAYHAVSTDLATGKIKNEALQVADTAPIADAALANKKYVDDLSDGGEVSRNDSTGNAMEKAHAYLSQTAGFVTAYSNASSTSALQGYVGSTDDPAGAGTSVALNRISAAGTVIPFISFFVTKGKYFEITESLSTVTITWTPLVSGGGYPIDQD